ncbi:MAG: hypothetical protein HZA29_04675 [Candidatus Omnitrophica bacterium]|nr:hypothetical protein [Candidatus Omnitrophota bacterium]
MSIKNRIVLISLVLFSPVIWALSQAEEQAFVYDDHGKRDPFWPLVGPTGNIINYDKESHASDLKIEGIISTANGQNLAIIDGQVVKKNDLVGDFLVVEIRKDRVVLTQGQQRFELKFNKEE